MYFSPVLLSRLKSRDHGVREEAERTVSTQVRKSYEAKYGKKYPGTWVNFADLLIKELSALKASTTGRATRRPARRRTKISAITAEGNPNCKCDEPRASRCPVHDA